ncbi:DUF4328 domain-containing protein [Hymenobacter tibetensis]|uniref:DUF4328 domain-containing protein n=1 Tax=Hymenobacter tibetensis TaxID=497967 RepID=A0ABY4D475_9BACT|nr:DUF4328 domain-containing protein [Hymenobacter tibetensis]UOG76749.1 DUF4328 domain-containing protein [Hymenobacter tibetensis]
MLRDNAQRAQQAIVIHYVIASGALGAAILDLLYVNRLSHGAEEPSTLDSLLDFGQGAMGFVTLVLLTAGFVVLIRWLRRAYVNLKLAGLDTEYSDGWAAGAWFVPFINLLRPYTITREVWRSTQLQSVGSVQPHTLLRIWWFVHVFDSVVGNISGRRAFSAETIVELQSSTWFSFFANLLGIASAVLTAQVIQRISRFEEDLQLQAQVQSLGSPAPEPVEYMPSDFTNEQYF